jgi:hypothetical protein
MVALGPGVLTLTFTGEAGTFNASCLINNLEIAVDVSVGESTFKLCGTEVPGTLTPSGTMSGNVDQDIDVDSGLFELCSKHWGESAEFTFEPSTSAGLEARGRVLVVPLSFGGTDAYGTPLTSDISFGTVGDIEYHRGGALAWTQTMSPKQGQLSGAAATGATAGTPGTWTPPGSTPPASVGTIGAVVASPATAWTVGQYVQTATAGTPGQAHWDGAAWAAGAAD